MAPFRSKSLFGREQYFYPNAFSYGNSLIHFFVNSKKMMSHGLFCMSFNYSEIYIFGRGLLRPLSRSRHAIFESLDCFSCLQSSFIRKYFVLEKIRFKKKTCLFNVYLINFSLLLFLKILPDD